MRLELASHETAESQSGGRVHSETADPLRGVFELDRHRILSSAAFRRLEQKTQVFAPSLSDHFRTRLTHTLEVAHLARSVARALRASEDLAEAIALAHDLGHPPFGHAGEAALHQAMRDHGGFNHNTHSLRVVEYLEHPFPAFRGLNLTRATLAGLAFHVTQYDTPSAKEAGAANVGSSVRTFLPPLPTGDRKESSMGANFPLVRESFSAPSVEAQIVSLADRLAYNLHDIEDAIGAELIALDDLAVLEPWRAAYDRVANDFSDRSIFALRRPVIDVILDGLLADAVTTSRAELASISTRETANDVSKAGSPHVLFSSSGEQVLRSVEDFLVDHVYRHPEITRTDAEGGDVVRALFDQFLRDPSLLPPRFLSRISDQGSHRVINDYIAGMTDRFCKTEHIRLGLGRSSLP